MTQVPSKNLRYASCHKKFFTGKIGEPVRSRKAMVIVLIGVSGSGKSTIGKQLARELDCKFYEGDNYHSPANKKKMRAGIPLTDADRWPWLAKIRDLIFQVLAQEEDAVVACSALAQSYRDYLRQPGVQFVYLKGDFDLFRERLEKRQGHFFDPDLLASQFEALEKPRRALVVDVAQTPAAIVRKIQDRLRLGPREQNRLTPKAESPPIVLTIGHSTRTLDEFIHLLQAHDVSRVVDVRTVPRSRHNPQFNKASLPRALKKVGVRYVHLPGLGGLRHAKRDSPNMGWRNTSFRGYADYMQTPEFDQSLEELIELAKQQRIVLMCAEAVPWRCHRSLIADALLIRGIRTEDIMSPARRTVHTLTPFAKVRGTTITYPAEKQQSTQKNSPSKQFRQRPVEKSESRRRPPSRP
jgi:carbohydrate kinase (thermoresistant glucokinase family)